MLDPPSPAFLPTSLPSTSLPSTSLPPSKPENCPSFNLAGEAKQSSACKMLAKPFRTPLAPLNGPPSSASVARTGAKRGAELGGLQRRAQVLRQALKYEQATVMSGFDSDAELERLCDKWKDAGK